MAGKLYLVSVGPGVSELITPMAERAIKESDVIVGYELYLTWIQDWIVGKKIFKQPLTQERERAATAIAAAREGATVSLISSGDIGVYAMAALAYEEMSEDDTFSVALLPGITAALSCASLLGAPLSHDFATLSLSDLLCPWEWIERRARAIAQADLAAVFYNVQSKARPDGIHKVLKIMMEYKSPDTVCGAVRNAYRPDQSLQIMTLAQLDQNEFDMFTTVVVGNRFTRRKRDWIFTPRGYNAWQEEAQDSAPRNAIWVFSGTGDGNGLAKRISEAGYPVVVSAATKYGQQVAREFCPDLHIRGGHIGASARKLELQKSAAKAIVDATHPFASKMSEQLIDLAAQLHLPYLRYERENCSVVAKDIFVCSSVEEATEKAMAIGSRIFLATGAKTLAEILASDQGSSKLWFARVTADPDFIQTAISSGIPLSRICAMQGPFSAGFNEELWKQWQIDCVVTKESGDAGGFQSKLEAARKLKIPLIVIQRPRISYPAVVSDSVAALSKLDNLLQSKVNAEVI
jgi:precorrin-3B C17-methyltransferase